MRERCGSSGRIFETEQDRSDSLLFGEFATFAQQMTEGLEQADFATRRKLLRLLVKRIEVDQDEVERLRGVTLS